MPVVKPATTVLDALYKSYMDDANALERESIRERRADRPLSAKLLHHKAQQRRGIARIFLSEIRP